MLLIPIIKLILIHSLGKETTTLLQLTKMVTAACCILDVSCRPTWR